MAMVQTAEKACSRCGTIKPLGAFSPHPGGKLGRQSWCKECRANYLYEQRSDPNGHYARYTVAQRRAQQSALARLRDCHRDEYEALLDEAMRAEGLR